MEELVAVRTYLSEQEIRDEPGFEEGNPVSKQNYARIILGDYRLPEQVHCCIQKKSGNGLCNKGHNYGFVVRLANESVSIIGNRCGKSHFDAESKVARDMALYINAKRRQETLDRIAELLKSKDECLARVHELDAALHVARARLDMYRQQFGDICTNQLVRLAQGGTGAVVVMGERVRRDETGARTYDPRDRFAIPVGVLRGLTVFRPGQFRVARDGLRKVMLAFEKAQGMVGTEKSAELAAIAAEVADFSRVVTVCEELLTAEREFSLSDWTPLPFLVRDLSDQYKLARIAFNHAGHHGGKDMAKGWLQKLEAALKSQHGVDRLSRAY